MDYPQDFPAESRARVEASIIRAGRKFNSACERLHSSLELEKAFWTCVLTPFLVFAEEACLLRRWTADELDKECREALRRLTIDAYHQKGRGIIGDPIDNWDGSLRSAGKREIEGTSQWRRYDNLRLKYAIACSSRPQNSDKTNEGAEGKSADAAVNETDTLDRRLQSGKRCAQIVDEVKRFRYLKLDAGKTLTEIQADSPSFVIWKLRENLNAEERELFDHPNRWEVRPAMYAYGLLGKEYGRSWATIRDWVKAWNRSQRPAIPPHKNRAGRQKSKIK